MSSQTSSGVKLSPAQARGLEAVAQDLVWVNAMSWRSFGMGYATLCVLERRGLVAILNVETAERQMRHPRMQRRRVVLTEAGGRALERLR